MRNSIKPTAAAHAPAPAPAPAPIPAPVRLPLQDASQRINQSPVRLPPIRSSHGQPAWNDAFWKEELAEVKRAADSLRSMYQGGPATTQEPHLQNAKTSNTQQQRGPSVKAADKDAPKPLTVTRVPIPTIPAMTSAVPAAQPQPSTAKPTAAGGSRKRKAETSLEEDIAAYKQDLSHIDVDDMVVDQNCNQVRKKINQLLDGGIMKKGEFCDAIGSSNKSLNTFLQKRGAHDGIDSYTNAWGWFKQREIAGLKMPDVKKRQKTEAAKKPRTAEDTPDLSAIHLEGEETDSVAVFDSADEIRKKISAHLKTPGLTQAQFCRDLYAQLKAPKCSGIQSKQLADFRGKKGPLSGVKSSVFYAAYVYFEKLRVAKGKPKSAHRLEMEQIHGAEGGLSREFDGNSSFICFAGEQPYMDQYGRIKF